MNRLYWSKTDAALLLMRVVVGLMMAVHGYGKVANFAEMSTKFADPFGMGPTISLVMAIFAELGCSFLLLVGLFTPVALLFLIVTMLVAAFIAHADDPWKVKELAVLYLSIYVTLLVSGPGRYSLDYKLFGSKGG